MEQQACGIEVEPDRPPGARFQIDVIIVGLFAVVAFEVGTIGGDDHAVAGQTQADEGRRVDRRGDAPRLLKPVAAPKQQAPEPGALVIVAARDRPA
jgi:hypothetical protein